MLTLESVQHIPPFTMSQNIPGILLPVWTNTGESWPHCYVSSASIHFRWEHTTFSGQSDWGHVLGQKVESDVMGALASGLMVCLCLMVVFIELT